MSKTLEEGYTTPGRWRDHPPASRFANPEAGLSRTDPRALGYERRAIDAIFRACRVVALPGYTRPLLRVSDFQAFLAEHTYNGRDRVR
jgi:hypothetical protein